MNQMTSPVPRGNLRYFPDGTAWIEAEKTTTVVGPTALMSIPIPTDSTVTLRVEVAGHRRSNGDSAGYLRFATFKRIAAGNVTIVGAVATVATQEDDAGWDVTFVAGTNEVTIAVTGVAFEVQWSGRAMMTPARLK